MENYFNYFTEIEEQFCRRRGTLLTVSTLDWSLMETWKNAGIPLEAVLRGIDATFDKYDRRPSKTRKINSLAYCSQEVLAAAEQMKEAAVGGRDEQAAPVPGLGKDEIADYLRRNSGILQSVLAQAGKVSDTVFAVIGECAATLNSLADRQLASSQAYSAAASAAAGDRLEDLERHLTVLEEKLVAALTATAPESDLFALRSEADREIAPYRSKMPGLQIEQLRKQFVHKRLLEKAKIPRLSLFYM